MKWGTLLGIGGLAVLAVGCSSDGTYAAARTDFETGAEPAFARRAMARPAGQPMQTAEVLATAISELPTTQADPAAPAPDFSGELSLDRLLAAIPQVNPAVQAARQQASSVQEQVGQATQLQMILDQYNAFTKQLDTQVGPQQHRDMLAMSYPPGKGAALQGEVIALDVQLAELQVEIAIREARYELRLAYYDLLYIDEAMRVNEAHKQLLSQILEVAQEELRGGQAGYNAVLMAQVDMARREDAGLDLESDRADAQARLNTVLGRDPAAAIGPLAPVPDQLPSADLAALTEQAIAARPELRMLRLKQERIDAMVRMVGAMNTPNASTGVSQFETRARLQGGTDLAPPAFPEQRGANVRQAVGYGMSQPYAAELTARREAIDEQYASAVDRLRGELQQTLLGLERSTRRLHLQQDTLLPQARQSVDAARAAYRAGKLDFLRFLESQRTLLAIELSEQEARRDLHRQDARLQRLVSAPVAMRPMPRHAPEDMESDAPANSP